MYFSSFKISGAHSNTYLSKIAFVWCLQYRQAQRLLRFLEDKAQPELQY